MYGYICPDCGDHLDPGDRCGCDLYMDSRLVTMEGEVICKDCLNDEMGGHHDI